jgi:hypothetical protein
MDNTFFIYLATRLSGIQAISVSIAVASGIALLVLMLYRLIELDDNLVYEYKVEQTTKRIEINSKKQKIARRFLFISLFFAVFTPNTKEAVMIYAGGKTLDYVQKDTSLQKIPYKATELILKKMDQYLNDSTITN